MDEAANPALPSAVQSTEQDFQTGQVLTIISGHFIHDMYSSFLSPLLPLIIDKLALTLTQAGSLSALMQLPALMNPFIGYVGDRLSLRYFIILAPAVTGTLMSLLGLAPNFATLAAMLITAGVSVAAFHAPAPAMVSHISGTKVGRGMSMFMAAGELGRSIGALLVVTAVSLWTLEGMFRIAVIGWAASGILFWRLRTIPARTTKQQDFGKFFVKFKRVFLPILALVVLPGLRTAGLGVFLPTFMTQRGMSLQTAGALFSVFQLAGVGGALLSGSLSDRLGRKPVLAFVMTCAPIFLLLFANVPDLPAVPALILLGFVSLSGTPVLLAIIQDHFPENRGTANGIFIASAFISRSLATLAVGVLGDRFGLSTTFTVGALVSLLALPVLLLVPKVDDSVSAGS